MPTSIDAAEFARPANFNQAQGPMVFGPYAVGAAMYVVMVTGTFPTTAANVYKSMDNGLSWSALDFGNGPSILYFVAYCNGTVIRVAYAGQPGISGASAVTLQDFDLGTELWLSPVGGGPNSFYTKGIAEFSNGDCIVFFAGTNPLTDEVFGSIYSGGFGSTIDVDANAPADLGTHISVRLSCVIDAADNCHTFFTWTDSLTPANHFMYQLIDAAGALGTFEDFCSIEPSMNTTDMLGQPCVFGNFVIYPCTIFGISGSHATIFYGTPATNPTWNCLTSEPAIDPDWPSNLFLESASEAWSTVIAGILYVVYICSSDDGTSINRIRLCQTGNSDPTTGWSAQTVFDGTTVVDPSWIQGDLSTPWFGPDSSGALFGFAQSSDPTGSLPIYWFLFGAPTPPVTPSIFLYIDPNLPVIPIPEVPLADSTGMVREFDCCPPKRLKG